MQMVIFQSTLSVRRATASNQRVVGHSVISIHALREESDDQQPRLQRVAIISIHALREESDQVTAVADSITESFQSTLSVRRAT